MTGRICIIIGTRPEAIKMSPVVRACERQGGVDWFMGHAGQERSRDVGRVCSGGLGLPDGRYNLEVGSGGMERRWGMLAGIECQTRVQV